VSYSDVRITNLHPDNENAIHQAAALLVRGFQKHWPTAWPDMKTALKEVQQSFGEERISRVEVDPEIRTGC